MIVLPFPPAILAAHAGFKGGYAKARTTKQWREKVAKVASETPAPAIPDARAYTSEGDLSLTVRFYPPSKQGDRCNFPNRCKPIFDGLADAWGVNDARFVPHFEFHAPEAPGRVEIDVVR